MHYFSKKKTQDTGSKKYCILYLYEMLDVHYLYRFLMYISKDIMLYITKKLEEKSSIRELYTMNYKKTRHWVFGIFFIFIHMTRFYTKNSQLNSTNLHSWGMLKKIQLKNPLLPVTHNPNILQCREGGWGHGGGGHIQNKSLPKEINFTFPLHTGSKWLEYNLQFIFFSCGFLWKQKN